MNRFLPRLRCRGLHHPPRDGLTAQRLSTAQAHPAPLAVRRPVLMLVFPTRGQERAVRTEPQHTGRALVAQVVAAHAGLHGRSVRLLRRFSRRATLAACNRLSHLEQWWRPSPARAAAGVTPGGGRYSAPPTNTTHASIPMSLQHCMTSSTPPSPLIWIALYHAIPLSSAGVHRGMSHALTCLGWLELPRG